MAATVLAAGTSPGDRFPRRLLPLFVRASMAVMSLLSSSLNATNLCIEEFVDFEIFHVPIALGTIPNLEAETRCGPGKRPYRWLSKPRWGPRSRTSMKPVGGRRGPSVGCRGRPRRPWSVLSLLPAGGAAGLTALLGKKIKGIVSSGPAGRSMGAFQTGSAAIVLGTLETRLSEIGGPRRGRKGIRRIGSDGRPHLVERVASVFAAAAPAWALQFESEPLRDLLRDCCGPVLRHAKAAAFLRGTCWRREPAMWTFLYKKGVEPTNNHIECLLRPGVLWW